MKRSSSRCLPPFPPPLHAFLVTSPPGNRAEGKQYDRAHSQTGRHLQRRKGKEEEAPFSACGDYFLWQTAAAGAIVVAGKPLLSRYNGPRN